MWLPPLASPGNVDWQLITPRQQAAGLGSMVPIIKPGNCAWLYVFLVGSGSGGAGGATGASGTNRGGGGGGASGMKCIGIFPWATLPDVIYANVGIGGAGGAANLGNGGAGNASFILVEPVAFFNASISVIHANGGSQTSGVSGGPSTAASAGGDPWGHGVQTLYRSFYGSNGGNFGGAGTPEFALVAGGSGGGGTDTSNTNNAGGGMPHLFTSGPGQILGSSLSLGGDGAGAAGGGAGANGRNFSQGPESPLALFQPMGLTRPPLYLGGAGGGSNGTGTGGKGGAGDWGSGGGGGGAGVTGGVGGPGGDGFIIIGNF